jgi:hypothetical protein
MPTILSVDGYKVQIFTQDHLPPHVHVFARGCEAIVFLNCSQTSATLRENFRFNGREIKAIMRIVQAHQAALCEAWEDIHDDLD